MNLTIPGAPLIFLLLKKMLDLKCEYDYSKQTINKYFKKYDQTPGIYEHDCYTQLITNAIECWRLENSTKNIILMIEDLDRMDPSHVFRILNIFSAHIDYSYTNEYCNKFGFDKIITVCLYENIRNIFKHVYGDKTDFNGYIRKFTTSIPFKYSIQGTCYAYLYEHIKKTVLSIFYI